VIVTNSRDIKVGDRVTFDGSAATVIAPFTLGREQMLCCAIEHTAGRLWTLRFDDGSEAPGVCEYMMEAINDAA
jgi:hypothetical protein